MAVALIFGLLLPWAAGALWFYAVAPRTVRGRPFIPVALGYGLFAGYFALLLLQVLSDRLTGGVSVMGVTTGLVIIALAGLVVARKRRAAQPQTASPALGMTRLETSLFCVFVLAASAHWLFAAIEILHIPGFPWDGWSSWLYRAKAWFYAGQMLPMASPEQWISDGNTQYNTTGSGYPNFVPAVAMWMALTLGQWSETLINLPTLACGSALALGLYGQCRLYGLPPWAGALAAYALLSLPLLGAHMSLGGHADIWMAGFSGLGLVALLHGLARERRSQLLLGLLMLAAAIAVKREGIVWLASALLAITLVKVPLRSLFALAGLTAVLAAAAWLLGITVLEVPLLGRVGLSDSTLYLSYLGSFQIQRFNLLDSYVTNFFLGGSWHLLWSVLLATAAGAAVLPIGKTRRAVIALLLALLAVQFVIFNVTEMGRWAEDWTAINRLPMQIVPALIFAISVTLFDGWKARQHQQGLRRPSLRIPLLGLLLACVVLGLRIYVAADNTDVEQQTYESSDMRFVVGGGRNQAGARTVTRYSDGNIAILSSGDLRINADAYKLLRLETSGDNTRRVTVFWRSAGAPDSLYSANLRPPHEHWIDLTSLDGWNGEIGELGLVFYRDGEREARFHRLELLPATPWVLSRKLLADWTQRPYWSFQSVNWMPAGSKTSIFSVSGFAAIWFAGALLVFVILRRSPGAREGVFLCALLAWALLDARWLANRAAQATRTTDAYPLITASYLTFGDDKRTHDLMSVVRPIIDKPGMHTIIVIDERDMRYDQLRAKYLALPAATYAHRGAASKAPLTHADFLLVIRQYNAAPGYEPRPVEYWNDIARNQGRTARLALERPDALLLRLEATEVPGG